MKQSGYFTISITAKHNKDYWLITECKENALLYDVDQFLRVDFGSTTDLILTVSDYRIGSWKNDKITLLARNNPIEFICEECGKKAAVTVCLACIYEGVGFLCEDCEETHECGSDMLLPVCNSPRCGVCSYVGSSIYDD